MEPLYLGLSFFATLVALGLLFFELHLRAKRTRVLQLPGGLRFEAQKFSVLFQRGEKAVQVHCARGVLTPAGAAASQAPTKAGRVECKFAALGFRAEVRDSVRTVAGQATPVRTGFSEISLRGADGQVLCIQQVNPAVAADFVAFFRQVRNWIDKLEQRLERERVARLRSEAAAAQAQQEAELLERLLGPQPPEQALEQEPSAAALEAVTAAQLALWRQSAGFQGQHCRWQADARGVVVWLVDLADDGRITLHADKHTIHSTLHGASISSTGGGLQIGVRDAWWTEQEPELRLFKVLQLGPDERRAWKERLERIRKDLSLPGDAVDAQPAVVRTPF